MVDRRHPRWRDVAIVSGFGLGAGVSAVATAGLGVAVLTVIDRWWFQFLAVALLAVVAVTSGYVLHRLSPAAAGVAVRLHTPWWPLYTVMGSMLIALAAVVVTATGNARVGVWLLAVGLAAAVAGPTAYAGLLLVRHQS